MDDCPAASCSWYSEVEQVCSDAGELYYEPESNILCIGGRIGTAGYQGVLTEEIRALPLKNSVRVGLASEGGALAGAVDMVEHLEKFDYSAIAYGICASACAQFLFLGSQYKAVVGEGILAMHGGPSSDEQIDALEYSDEIKVRIRAERDRFVKFYADRGLDISITYDFPQDLLDKLAEGQIVFWPVSRQSFAEKGITGITYCGARFENVNEPEEE